MSKTSSTDIFILIVVIVLLVFGVLINFVVKKTLTNKAVTDVTKGISIYRAGKLKKKKKKPISK